MALVLAGCKVNEPEQKVGLPVSICLPANEVQSARYMPRRVMGDPGRTENFFFPHYLYIIVMKEKNNVWSKWEIVERTLTDASWEPTRYAGSLPTANDSIYRYTETINLIFPPGERVNGRVYAIASAKQLTLSKDLSAITDLNDLLELTFDASSVDIQKNLQHIYSSPYNLNINGDYFGAFNSTHQKVPHLNMLLYHVAAKVDIKWSVAEDKRIDRVTPANGVRLTYMQVRNLFNSDAYCFKPMRNVSGSALTTGETIAIIDNSEDEGRWWEGRYYFYTIPYTITEGGKQYYPLQMTLKTNGSTGTGYQPTLNLKIDTTAVFVPWLRANFNLTAPLTDKTETKTVDN